MPQSPQRDASFQWAELTDFSPGIFSNDNLAGGANVAGDVTSTNLAMAQVTDTWGCRALPTGGLGPLPLRKFSLPVTTPPAHDTGRTYTINGMNSWGFVLSAAGGAASATNHRVEVHLLVTYPTDNGDDTWTNSAYWLRERVYENPQSTETIYSDIENPAASAVTYNYAHFIKTRMNPTTPDDIGLPVMACVWSSDNLNQHVNQVFPDPANPTVTDTIDLATAAGNYRHGLGHQGRVVLARYINYDHGADTGLSTDENVLWTETNDNTLVTADPAAFVPEVDHTISDWASMSANQMVVIKRIGGGYVLQGDLSDVTVVRLPNLKSPDGTALVKGCNTPLGFIYSAGDNGLYLWNGGDTSEPISNQLDGKAFTDITGIDRLGIVGQCDRWGDLLLAPHGWCCDLETRSWWRIESPDQPDAMDEPILYWSQTNYEGQVVGVPRHFTDDDETIFIYELDTLTYTYSWRSQSLWASQDRYIETREAIMAIEGAGAVTISVIDEDDNTSSHEFVNTYTSGVHNFRCNLALTAENLQVKIVSTGVGYGPLDDDDLPTDIQAPMVHRCYIGYVQKQHLALSQ